MTKDELLSVLNDDACRLGLVPITARVLERMVEDGLIEPARAKGRKRGVNPTWSYSEDSVAAARMIVEFKAKGVQRTAALKLHLWAYGSEFPFEQIKEALNAEFQRFLKREHRKGYWEHDRRDIAELNDKEKRKIKKELVSLHPALAEVNFSLSEETFTKIISELFWGASSTVSFRTFLETIIGSQNIEFGASADLMSLYLGGVMASPEVWDENALAALNVMSPADLDKGRDLFRFMMTIIGLGAGISGFFLTEQDAKIPAFQVAANSIGHDDWLIFTVVAGAISNLRRRVSGE